MAEVRIASPAAATAAQALADGIAAIREELALPDAFPPDALAEAERPVTETDWLVASARVDRTDLELVTLDPPGSRDLDQALHLSTGPGGAWTVHYAIADVAAHVRPGGAIDRESQARGETVYLPGARVPLHPPALSEDAASLLPAVDRLAVLWTLTVDARGELAGVTVERATVRSTAQLNYADAQTALDAGAPHPQIALLAQLGPLLQQAARRRGAIELPEPSQELVDGPGDDWQLAWLPRTPLEDWNAQLSLLTGRAAASLMLGSGWGLLRTLPPPPPDAEPQLRVAATALGVTWPDTLTLADRLATLDATSPAELALIDRARTLLRGADYRPLIGGPAPSPDDALHYAVAAPYAHVTAPLRRLGDRYATEAVLASVAAAPIPTWVADALPTLPDLLTTSGRRAGTATRSVVDLAEAIALDTSVGARFDACVVDATDNGGEIRIVDPPIRSRVTATGLKAGTRTRVELAEVDVPARRVRFVAPGHESGPPTPR